MPQFLDTLLSPTRWDWHSQSLGSCSIFSNCKPDPAQKVQEVLNQWAATVAQCCQFLPFPPNCCASDAVIKQLHPWVISNKVIKKCTLDFGTKFILEFHFCHHLQKTQASSKPHQSMGLGKGYGLCQPWIKPCIRCIVTSASTLGEPLDCLLLMAWTICVFDPDQGGNGTVLFGIFMIW